MKYRHIFSRKLIFIGFLIASIVVAGFVFSNTILASLGFWSTDSLNKGLVGHWPLDGAHLNSTTNRVDDISGYENHGTNSGATLANGVMGESEGAMSFNGSSNYINTENNTPLNPNNGSFSISLWIKTTDASGNVIKKDSGSGAGYKFDLASGWNGNCIFWFFDDTIIFWRNKFLWITTKCNYIITISFNFYFFRNKWKFNNGNISNINTKKISKKRNNPTNKAIKIY